MPSGEHVNFLAYFLRQIDTRWSWNRPVRAREVLGDVDWSPDFLIAAVRYRFGVNLNEAAVSSDPFHGHSAFRAHHGPAANPLSDRDCC